MRYQKATVEEAIEAAKRHATSWHKPAYVYACGPMFTIEPVAPFRPHYVVYPNGETECVEAPIKGGKGIGWTTGSGS